MNRFVVKQLAIRNQNSMLAAIQPIAELSLLLICWDLILVVFPLPTLEFHLRESLGKSIFFLVLIESRINCLLGRVHCSLSWVECFWLTPSFRACCYIASGSINGM